MIYIGICILAFVLFFIYDINGVTKNCPIIKPFFFLGGALLLGDLIVILCLSRFQFSLDKILIILFAILFFTLLVYTLFFALPFKETYLSDGLPSVCDTGVYALCRHPGVLWLLGFSTMLCFLFDGELIRYYTLTANLLNLLYIIFQDIYTFPKLFCNYHDYKKKTPFLIPNIESIHICFKSV
ncbi:MAG: hypothetical protein RR444_06845 [Oscillospiraceae bacterium]